MAPCDVGTVLLYSTQMSFVQIAQSWMRNCWILHWEESERR